MFMATAERAERRIAEQEGGTENKQKSNRMHEKKKMWGVATLFECLGVRVKNGWFVSHRWLTSLICQYVMFGFGFVVLLITTIVFSIITKSSTNAEGFETCSARTGESDLLAREAMLF